MLKPAIAHETAPAPTMLSLPQIVQLGAESAWADSPARQLHERLLQTFATVAPAPVRWLPARTRVGIVAGASLLLWGVIGAAALPFLS